MTCPVCKRELAPTLSICFTCGTMVNDTVREELETKIGRGSDPLDRQVQRRAEAVMAATPNLPPSDRSFRQGSVHKNENIELEKPVSPFRVDTSELGNKKTSPTLVEFQHRNPNIPDWRLQLQNAVRQRKNHEDAPSGDVPAPVESVSAIPIQNAAAQVRQRGQRQMTAPATDSRIENALKRIETSRDRFLAKDQPLADGQAEGRANARSFPFGVVNGAAAATVAEPSATPSKATVNTLPKPKLVSAMKIEKRKYDTNKLPKLFETSPVQETARDPEVVIEQRPVIAEEAKIPAPTIAVAEESTTAFDSSVDLIDEMDSVDDASDDLAPMSSRLTAGLFDLIFGTFASAIVISPLMLAGGNWLSLAGVLAGAAIFGIVMFVYLTLSVGYFGRTIGMKFFSLELIDAEANEYPTFHQAAVNAAVFLIALPFLGAGFLPAFFNEERRAAHDLFSGTVLVREV